VAVRTRPAWAALALGIALIGCGRQKQESQVAVRDTVSQAPPYVNPADEPHPAPPQPSGPQIGHSDPLMNAIAPEMAEWVTMWRAVLPGLKVDSLWGGKPRKWVPEGVERLESIPAGENEQDDEGDLTARVLGLPSPDGQRHLDIDVYQLIQRGEEGIEAGGEPESKSELFDRRNKTLSVLNFCGTSCGSHWGRWLSADRFVLGGWSDADEYSQWKQGDLTVYDLRDSTVTTYLTRIVSSSDYERYYAAWKQWLLKRERETRPRPRT
jgi:hypothetical protein